MRMANQTPPSRQGKKQVIAFLRPNQIEAVYAKAARERKTNQEIIGEALNAMFALHGMPPLIKEGHKRLVRRSRGRARVRTEASGSASRAGRQALGGWYEEEVVLKLGVFASEVHLSVQGIIEKGIEMVTGVAPSEEENDWMSALPEDEAA